MQNVTLDMVYKSIQEVNQNLLALLPHLQLIPYIYVSAAISVGMFIGLVVVIKKMLLLEERLLSIELKVEQNTEKIEKLEEKILKLLEKKEKTE
ncbi:NEQ153 [Nanoarchaeum equitans Kin4-M]|uniref:NEQ153 n=1 Tax=Nanoarchaeum equitans (strain Kin4-M) TaxID=228908 RepID=Q74NA5_NANEQ|nr:NEQ153 [Nanoarchaeum equitans Kin4-M]